jgi:prepilin-type N-terminal cleavage/methylation domain-containing protein
MHFKNVGAHKRGFTIVELLVVIAVIAILAAISIVSYGAWKKQAATAQVKSDLNAVAAAMESARTFNNAYPTTLPGTVAPSKDVSLSSGVIGDGLIYCVDGTSSQDATILYYVDSTVSDKGAQVGTCASRPGLLQPSIPANLAVVSADGTTVGLSWSAAANAASYTAQCASDPAFIMGMRETTATQPTVVATVAGLTPSSTFYCRVKAVNTVGSSTWSAYVSTTTNNAYGSLAIATSVDGYWTAAPTGFLLEDGSAVSRTTYSALFAVIGTTYGAGDGSTTFNLPDSRGRASVNKSTDTEFDTMGEKSGSKTEALTIAQIPSHTHIQDAHAHGVYDPGHNHSQNPHMHGQVVTANAGPSVRSDWNSDSASGAYAQGINTSDATGTNNPATTGIGIYNATATNQYTGGGAAHNNIQPSIVKLSAIKYTPESTVGTPIAPATSVSGYWSAAPTGYLAEDGSAVSRATYANLFNAIGTTYGVGDGLTTFNLPDSRGRVSVNKSSDVEFNAMGKKYGEKSHVLTIAELASHTHIQDAHAHGVYDPGHNHSQNGHSHPQMVTNPLAGWPGIRNDYDSDAMGNIYSQGITTGVTTATNNPSTTGIGIYNATATNQYTGGGGAHNEIQPSIVKMFAIKY